MHSDEETAKEKEGAKKKAGVGTSAVEMAKVFFGGSVPAHVKARELVVDKDGGFVAREVYK